MRWVGDEDECEVVDAKCAIIWVSEEIMRVSNTGICDPSVHSSRLSIIIALQIVGRGDLD